MQRKGLRKQLGVPGRKDNSGEYYCVAAIQRRSVSPLRQAMTADAGTIAVHRTYAAQQRAQRKAAGTFLRWREPNGVARSVWCPGPPRPAALQSQLPGRGPVAPGSGFRCRHTFISLIFPVSAIASADPLRFATSSILMMYLAILYPNWRSMRTRIGAPFLTGRGLAIQFISENGLRMTRILQIDAFVVARAVRVHRIGAVKHHVARRGLGPRQANTSLKGTPVHFPIALHPSTQS